MKKNSNLFPDFLIIGAMKAGTTTLYRDLYDHPEVFLPEEKEPDSLAYDDVLTIEGSKNYQGMFAGANDGQLIGEASTSYAKAPYFGDVPGRALELCGSDLKIIYVVREPFERMVSQYKFEKLQGLESRSIEAAILEDHKYVAFSSYHSQLQDWLDVFGRKNVFCLNFEWYIENRELALVELSRFLGLDPSLVHIDQESKFNSSEGNRLLIGFWGWFLTTSFYSTYIRPLISWRLRNFLANTLMRKAAAEKETISSHFREEACSRLKSEDWAVYNESYKG